MNGDSVGRFSVVAMAGLSMLGALAVTSPRAHAERGSAAASAAYAWLPEGAAPTSLASRFSPPEGFARAPVARGSYAEWLRNLPMMPPGSPVLSYRGDEVQPGNAPHLAGVVDLDVGREDLQQCADTILRLRAEYLWQRGAHSAIRFRFTSGDVSAWDKWARGYRPVISGPRARFVKRRPPSQTRQTFREYLTNLFRFAGTLSLAKEGRAVGGRAVLPGDFISLGGSPGHAIVVLDVVRDGAGKQRVLLGQSYMPAQSFHVLRDEGTGSPWFEVTPTGGARIATWGARFPWSKLRRFPGQ